MTNNEVAKPKPGTRCSRCSQPFIDDSTSNQYGGTIKIYMAKSNEEKEEDLCSYCMSLVIWALNHKKETVCEQKC